MPSQGNNEYHFTHIALLIADWAMKFHKEQLQGLPWSVNPPLRPCLAEDAVRYEREVEEFEKEHPGLLTSRKRQTKGLPKASTRPRQPLTAFKAFLLSNISADNNTKLKVI